MSAQFPRGLGRTGHTQLAVIISCDDPISCDEMDDYFATEANTMIYIIRDVDFDEYQL